MAAEKRHTWNPILHFDVVHGGLSSEELERRTLSFTLEDHATRYDQITWKLNNRDGLLTDPRHLGLGLMVRVRLGYADDTQRWRTFIISRVKGGVGVNSGNPQTITVGENEATVTYEGRNRNAPDLKRRKGRKKGSKRAKGRPRPTGRGEGNYSARFKGQGSPSIVQLDNTKRDAWHGPVEGERRTFHVRKTSDAVLEIARRIGYPDKQIFIQDTQDDVTQVVIPEGMSDANFLEYLAHNVFNWRFKMTPNEFRFHERRWNQSRPRIKEVFTYGGPDILKLNLDMDFRLPVPTEVKVKGYNPMKRVPLGGTQDVIKSPLQDKIGMAFALDDAGMLAPGGAQRKATLRRKYVYNVPGATKGIMSAKAQQHFVDRHVRALKMSLDIVGNPDIDGGDTIRVRGTGNPIVDGKWYVEVAKHVFSGTTYITQLDLRQPTKSKGKGKTNALRAEFLDKDSIKSNKAAYAIAHIEETPSARLNTLGGPSVKPVTPSTPPAKRDVNAGRLGPAGF